MEYRVQGRQGLRPEEADRLGQGDGGITLAAKPLNSRVIPPVIIGVMDLPRNHTCWTTFICATALSVCQPAFAQEPMGDVKRELAALRAESSNSRPNRRTQPPRPPLTPCGAAVEMMQTQVAELAQTKVESTTRFPVKLFGTVHAGRLRELGATANWLDNPNLVAATPADGQAGTMSASLRQTRIGFAADGPTLGSARTNAVVAMDFFGGIPGFQTGQVMGLPRLLVAFARIEGERTALEVGQDHMILAPRDPTSLAAFAFPLLFRSGNLYLRAPQVRVEQHVRVAPARGGRHRRADRRRLAGDDYSSCRPRSAASGRGGPGVQARFAYTTGDADAIARMVDVGVSGTCRMGAPRHALVDGWASGARLRARAATSSASPASCSSATTSTRSAARLGLDARSAGGWGEVQLFPSSRVSFTAGAGIDDIRGDRRLHAAARGENRSAYGNVMFSLTPEVQASFEYRWLRTLAGTAERRTITSTGCCVHKF